MLQKIELSKTKITILSTKMTFMRLPTPQCRLDNDIPEWPLHPLSPRRGTDSNSRMCRSEARLWVVCPLFVLFTLICCSRPKKNHINITKWTIWSPTTPQSQHGRSSLFYAGVLVYVFEWSLCCFVFYEDEVILLERCSMAPIFSGKACTLWLRLYHWAFLSQNNKIKIIK